MKRLFLSLIMFFLFLPLAVQAQDPDPYRMKADSDSSIYKAGDIFYLMIKINSGTDYVFSSSSTLNFPTAYLDVLSVAAGDFLGQSIIFYPIIDEANGKVYMSISQTSGQNGVVGIGTVYMIQFLVSNNAALNYRQVTFSNSDIDVRRPNGTQISFSNTNYSVTLCEAIVWPGDFNNNGIVNESDVLLVGLKYNKSGPGRSDHNFAWGPMPAAIWTDTAATYVDGTGDGVIRINDVPAVGFNYGKTHAVALSKVMAKIQSDNHLYGYLQIINDSTAELSVMAEAQDLFGIAFKMNYEAAEVSVDNVQLGQYLANAQIFFTYNDPESGMLAAAISLVNGQHGVTDTNSLIVVQLKLLSTISDIQFLDIVAVDEYGNNLDFVTTVLGVNNSEISPYQYVLRQNYPNPFNPSTTIKYDIPEVNVVNLTVYNILGQQVAILVNEQQYPGSYSVDFNVGNLPSGTYFYRLQAGKYIETKKMIILK